MPNRLNIYLDDDLYTEIMMVQDELAENGVKVNLSRICQDALREWLYNHTEAGEI